MSKKVFQKIARGLIVVALLLSATNLTVFAQETPPPIPTVEYFIVETKVLDDGTSIDKILINGPPTPPVGYERTTVELPEPNPNAGLVTLSVPAYNWSFGCSATSASMIAAFYDRGSYPGMYTGPTNNGTMPMNNSTWEDVIIAGETRHQCPLSATRNGLDERTIHGHVDDYWIQYGATGPDPYDGNWTEHTLGDCTGDYMKTNKWFVSEGFNTDGGTTFWYYTNGAPIPAADLEYHGVDIYDGGYGLKLFYESRGETVDAMYNQYIYGYVGDQGFTYDQYKAEIDADRPVMIHLEGHTVVGVGYDDSSSDLMYINDTWDYTTHPMIWGSTYSGMNHMGVTIVRLGVPTLVNLARFDATPQGRAVHVEWETATEIDNAGFHLWRSETKDGEYTQITDNLIVAKGGAIWGAVYEYEDFDVKPGLTYFYQLEDIDYDGVSAFHGPVSAWVGVVDIKANGSDGPVVVSPDTPVSVSVDLNPGEYEGQTAELWIAANTPFAPPFDWYTYVYPTGWQPGIHPYAQTPLFDLSPPLEIPNRTLPLGNYIFYFGVDGPDGMAAGPWLGLDLVEVEVR